MFEGDSGWLKQQIFRRRFWRSMCEVYQFARSVITKLQRPSGLNNRNELPHSFGGWKSQIKISAELVFSKSLSLDCRQPSFCVFIWPYLFVWVPTSSYTDTRNFGLGSTHLTSVCPNYLFTGTVSKESVLRYYRSGLQHTNFGGGTHSPHHNFTSI